MKLIKNTTGKDNKKQNTQLTIGLLINNFYNNYEFEIWEGANQAIIEHGAKLINFVGASINNPFFNNKQKNKIYELPDIKNIDGLLILSSSIGSYINHKEMEYFISSFHTIPHVSVGTLIENVPSIVIDNKIGFYELMIHLIEKHNYKKIAFIHGPKENKDIKERFETYLKVLKQYNIEINPDLIINGSFHPSFGKNAVSILLDERKIKFDVLIGSNDFVAINAVKELNRRGIKMPDDIAVVGFDNVIDCNYIENPLTTVNQPCFELGYAAGMKILSILNNENVSLKQEFDSRLVIRKSCGCKMKSNKINEEKLINQTGKTKIKYLVSLLIKFMNIEFNEIIKEADLLNWAKILLISIINDLENISSNAFLLEFKKIIKNPNLNKININSWNPIMTFIFNKIIPRIINLNENIKYNELFENVIKMINNYKIINSENSMSLINELTMILSSFKKEIHKIKNKDELKDIIYNFLPLFGIKSFYISILCCQKKAHSTPNDYEFFYGYKNYQNLKQECKNINMEYLIPDGIKNYKTNDTFIIFPLLSNNKFLGFTVNEIEEVKINSSNLMRTQMVNLYKKITSEIGIKIQSLSSYMENRDKTASKPSPKYKYINLSDEILKKYYEKILSYIEKEKPYLNKNLSLSEFAEKIEISTNNLSYIINKIFKSRFYNFINEYRIKEAKEYLQKNKNINYYKIASDSGFKSKTTFYKMFKMQTNMTPCEYRNDYLRHKMQKDIKLSKLNIS